MKTGCKLHPNCFTCPFPDCLTEEEYDTLYGLNNISNAKKLHEEGYSVEVIAIVMDKSIRTIQRYLKGY